MALIVKANILEDKTGLALARANEIHALALFDQFYTKIAKELEPTVERTDEFFMFRSRVPWPMMNSVWWLDPTDEVSKERAERVVESLRNHGFSQMWWLGELSTPKEVHETLEELGLRREEWDIPVMGVDLNQIDYSQIEALADKKNIHVRRVTTKEDLTEWQSVTQEVYNLPDAFMTALEQIHGYWLDKGESPDVQNFIADIKGTTVGASTLYLSGGLAGIYYVGTRKEFRGEGIGSAVTLAALKAGNERDYEVGILGASKLGQGVYERIGFKDYFKLNLYTG